MGKLYIWGFDNWHPHSPLLAYYAAEMVTLFGNTINSNLVTIMKDGTWNWPNVGGFIKWRI